MAAISWSQIFVLLLLTGGGRDLLDYLPTADYWRSKGVEVSAETMLAELTPPPQADAAGLIRELGHADYRTRQNASARLRALGPAVLPQLQEATRSPDAEVAARAEELIAELTRSSRALAVRRLMAIRALGEMRSRRALPALQALAGSHEPFVGEYARRAIAAIEDKPYHRSALPAQTLRQDLALLPADCALVAQMSLRLDRPPELGKLLAGTGPMLGGADKDATHRQIVAGVLALAERIGNARLDAATFGLAERIGERDGFAILIARGLYDAAAVRAAMEQLTSGEVEFIEGVPVLRPEGEVALLLPDDERFVFIAAPRGQVPAPAMAQALRAGKGALEDNEPMAALLRTVDTTSPLWAVLRASESYREAPALRGFDTLVLTSRYEQDRLEGRLVGAGSDAEQVRGSLDAFDRDLRKARAELRQVADVLPALQPVLDMLESVKWHADGTNVTGTARVENVSRVLLMPVLFLMSVQHIMN